MEERVTSLALKNGTATALTPPTLGAEPDDPSGETRRVVQMVITVVIFVVGMLLNGLVVWVLGVRGGRHEGSGGREEPRGAGTFRIYVVNLAVADLMLVLRTPLMLGYLAKYYHWPFGLAVCRLVMFLRGLGLYANAFLLCAISAERCLCLLRPLWFSMRRPRWSVLLACALLWLLSFLLSCPYFSSATVVSMANRSHCFPNIGKGIELLVTETVLGFLLPLLIFLVSNLAVMVTVSQAGGTVPTSPTSSPTPKRLVRLYRVLFLTMLLFLTCWVPFFVFRFLQHLASHRPDKKGLLPVAFKGMYVSLYLVYAKSALNPVLYVFAARGLGRKVKASIFSTVDRIFNEDTSDYARRRSLRRTDSHF